eukprot:1501353-Rhodomonas_salina.2
MNPSGVHTQFEAEHFKVEILAICCAMSGADCSQVDRCTLPVRLHYSDNRISQWWGHILEEQAAALVSQLYA